MRTQATGIRLLRLIILAIITITILAIIIPATIEQTTFSAQTQIVVIRQIIILTVAMAITTKIIPHVDKLHQIICFQIIKGTQIRTMEASVIQTFPFRMIMVQLTKR